MTRQIWELTAKEQEEYDKILMQEQPKPEPYTYRGKGIITITDGTGKTVFQGTTQDFQVTIKYRPEEETNPEPVDEPKEQPAFVYTQ